MLELIERVLDLGILAFALGSAWLWAKASRRKVRRVRRFEELDAADINRLVTALNRAQHLNARAALTTACAAILAGIRFLLDLLPLA